VIADALAALEGWPVAEALRVSRWTYPFVNVGHIVGLALLFGAILPLDLRLLGLWRTADADELERVLTPVSAFGLAMTLTTGFLLFSVRATEYAAMPLFWLKMAIVAAGATNALAALVRRMHRAHGRAGDAVLAGVSIGCWTAAIVAGRLLGYVE
jgi:formate-dependent nitrite reductase membrane component NrfD